MSVDRFTTHRGSRSIPSRKVAENLAQHSKEVQTLEELLSFDPTRLVGAQRIEQIESIKKAYNTLRVCLGGTIPNEYRLQVDRAINILQRKTSVSACSRKTGSVSSQRILKEAERARLAVEEENMRQEARALLELKRLEAQEITRRAEHDLKVAELEQRLELQRRRGELVSKEAELDVLMNSEDDASSHEGRSHVGIYCPADRPWSTESQAHELPVDKDRPTEDHLNTESRVPAKPAENESASKKREEQRKEGSTQSSTSIERELTKALNRIQVTPSLEPVTFSGDPLEYTQWKRAFHTLIGSKGIPPDEQAYYLQKSLKGEALECVKGLFDLDPDKALKSLWEILDKRFGNSFLTVNAMRKRLLEWPTVGNSDHKGLRKYADFLNQCAVAKAHGKGLEILDDPYENKTLTQKLPLWVTREWIKRANGTQDGFPTFDKFAAFVTEFADRANHPIFADFQSTMTNSGKVTTKSKHSVTKTARGLNTAVKDEGPKDSCQYCRLNNHVTRNCRKLGALNSEDSTAFVKSKQLCFGCLQDGHKSRRCQQRATCDVCQNKHPTSLHGNWVERNSQQPQADTAAALPMSTMSESRKHLLAPVIPVYLSTESAPDKEVLIYALLDSQSDTTFVLESVAESLPSAQHINARLKISTMTSSSVINCQRYDGLIIRGMFSQERVHLPATYSRSFIPADRNHIPTDETTKNWSHLEQLKDAIPPLQPCDVGLLIGYSCPAALAPLEVLLGERSEPYAQRTVLGWSIVGAIHGRPDDPNDENQHDLSENSRIIHRAHCIEMSPMEVLKTLEADFAQEKEGYISQDDLKFISIMQSGIRQDEEGYYEMPMPFRDSSPNLPDNRKTAEVRLQHLKKKFQKDAKFYEEYKAYMEEVLSRGEAEASPADTSRRWYIPHHGVYHPKKRKLRIVFDCSAQHHGTSLNEHLLPGPELMNSLVGILCRFRERPVAFTGDVERMFHRFRVREEDRDYLSFLWWKDGDIEDEVVTYRMKVHLFGATSSPACAIFAMRQLALDHTRVLQSSLPMISMWTTASSALTPWMKL